ncbi:MAG TPA: hypothetical protein DCS93_27855 [Microscillaceae bacterium]|nr:hypothetical protein [Microscillaceae bacterium]
MVLDTCFIERYINVYKHFMRKIILLALWFIWSISIQAQQNYEKAYKKARAFTNTHQDSAIIWATKCLTLAKTNAQKYKAHYLRGFNAKKLCLHGAALYDYKQARRFSPDSVSYFRVNNNLADTYLQIGDYKKAVSLNKQCIKFQKQAKEWVRLSYAYNLRGDILTKNRNMNALNIMHKVIKLRKDHAPQQLGYAYERMANTLATFSRYDSAIVYQRLAIKHHPIKSPENTAFLHTQLAKYLVMTDLTTQAYQHLEQAKPLKKTPMMQLFWKHTYGLYLAKTDQMTVARQIFDECNDLLQDLIDNAPDWVTKRTVSEQAKELYQNILALKRLKPTEHQLYKTRLRAVKASYNQAKSELKLKDTLYRQKIAQKTNADITSRHQSLGYEWWLVILIGLIGAMYLLRQRKRLSVSGITTSSTSNAQEVVLPMNVIGEVGQKNSGNNIAESFAPEQLREMKQLLAENNLIKLIEQKTGLRLPLETREMIRLYYQGLSMQKIAQKMGSTFGSVRYRFRNIAEKTGHVSFKDFINDYRGQQNEVIRNSQQEK